MSNLNYLNHPNWIDTWFSQVKEHAQVEIKQIQFSESREWSFVDSSLKHRSGRFFHVSAVRWKDSNNNMLAQPFFVQREIGTLGFALQDQQLLLQAKIEPGNVGLVQIAPTCQATASNLDRVHGGEVPLLADWFTRESNSVIHDSLQSEQGTRFFYKFNRNVLSYPNYISSPNNNFRWYLVDEVLELVNHDYLINTDARSVLVSSSWKKLVGRKPFTRLSTEFSKELESSFSSLKRNRTIIKKLQTIRSNSSLPELIKLNELENWEISDRSIAPIDKKLFEIIQIKVSANGREVSSWDQPILSSFGEGYVELVCGRIAGELKFHFSLQKEPGLKNIVELGPSLVIEPGGKIPETTYHSRNGAVILAENKQSDEGGRFFQDISTYRLIDLGHVIAEENEIWLNLAQVHELLTFGGWFTNEARSSLSLILSWL